LVGEVVRHAAVEVVALVVEKVVLVVEVVGDVVDVVDDVEDDVVDVAEEADEDVVEDGGVVEEPVPTVALTVLEEAAELVEIGIVVEDVVDDELEVLDRGADGGTVSK
jgi:hypothetical protein